MSIQIHFSCCHNLCIKIFSTLYYLNGQSVSLKMESRIGGSEGANI